MGGNCATKNFAPRGDNYHVGSRVIVCPFSPLFLGLEAPNDGNSEEVLVDATVELEGLHDHGVGLIVGGVGGVSLLPKEFPSSQKWGGVLELPSNDVTPLVELEGKVAVGRYPVAEGRVHDGLGGGADGNGLR